MRTLFFLLFLTGLLLPQSHGTYPAWSPVTQIPLSRTDASAGGGVPNTVVTLPGGKIIVFYSEQTPFPGGVPRPFFTGSSDYGITWTSPSSQAVVPVWKTSAVAGSIGAVSLPSGSVAVSWASTNPQAIYFALYDPLNDSWSDTIRVSKFVLRSTGYQFITADKKGRIHLVWTDGRIEPGSVQEVYYSRSTDLGLTWSNQIMLSNNDGRHSSFPCGNLSASSSDTLMFAWRDSTSPPRNWDVEIAVSNDGGLTWLTPRKLTTSPLMQSDPQVVADKHGGFNIIFHEYSTNCTGGLCASVYYGYSADGGNSWGNGFTVISPEGIRSHLCKSAYDSVNDRFWAFWKDERDFNFTNGNPEADIVGRYFENQGTLVSDTVEFISDMGEMEVAFHNFAPFPDGSIAAIWYSDYSQTISPRKMYFSRRAVTTAIDTREISRSTHGPSLSNHPNPFNPTTLIEFELVENSQTVVTVYDITGRKITEITNDYLIAGKHQFLFDARDLPTGVYLCEVTTPEFRSYGKMVFIK